jgi:DNA polymerase alpha-associated DNA helicase A
MTRDSPADMPQPTDIPSFAASQLTLLDAELQAELSETNALLSSHTPTALARAGLAILNLNVSSIRTGLGGKTVVELGLDSAVVAKGDKPDIPEHGIRVGDIVAVQDQPSGSAKKTEKRELEKKGAEGVVLRVRRETVEIVLDKEDTEVPSGGKLWMSVYEVWTSSILRRLIGVIESSWRTTLLISGTSLLKCNAVQLTQCSYVVG